MADLSNKQLVTNTELAVLGLVAEGPRHGYQVAQDIDARGMREWTEIGFSSIYYVLNKLEDAGWLESQLEAEAAAGKRGPARNIYSLTENGRDIYQAAVFLRLITPRPHSADFALALANLPAVPRDDVYTAIESQLAALIEKKRAVQEKNKLDRQATGKLPAHVEALFSYAEAQMAAELDWLAHFLASGIFENQGEKK